MKAFAIWYFEWGWILTTLLSIPVGFYAGRKRDPRILAAWLLLVTFGPLVLMYIKHS